MSHSPTAAATSNSNSDTNTRQIMQVPIRPIAEVLYSINSTNVESCTQDFCQFITHAREFGTAENYLARNLVALIIGKVVLDPEMVDPIVLMVCRVSQGLEFTSFHECLRDRLPFELEVMDGEIQLLEFESGQAIDTQKRRIDSLLKERRQWRVQRNNALVTLLGHMYRHKIVGARVILDYLAKFIDARSEDNLVIFCTLLEVVSQILNVEMSSKYESHLEDTRIRNEILLMDRIYAKISSISSSPMSASANYSNGIRSDLQRFVQQRYKTEPNLTLSTLDPDKMKETKGKKSDIDLTPKPDNSATMKLNLPNALLAKANFQHPSIAQEMNNSAAESNGLPAAHAHAISQAARALVSSTVTVSNGDVNEIKNTKPLSKQNGCISDNVGVFEKLCFGNLDMKAREFYECILLGEKILPALLKRAINDIKYTKASIDMIVICFKDKSPPAGKRAAFSKNLKTALPEAWELCFNMYGSEESFSANSTITGNTRKGFIAVTSKLYEERLLSPYSIVKCLDNLTTASNHWKSMRYYMMCQLLTSIGGKLESELKTHAKANTEGSVHPTQYMDILFVSLADLIIPPTDQHLTQTAVSQITRLIELRECNWNPNRRRKQAPHSIPTSGRNHGFSWEGCPQMAQINPMNSPRNFGNAGTSTSAPDLSLSQAKKLEIKTKDKISQEMEKEGMKKFQTPSNTIEEAAQDAFSTKGQPKLTQTGIFLNFRQSMLNHVPLQIPAPRKTYSRKELISLIPRDVLPELLMAPWFDNIAKSGFFENGNNPVQLSHTENGAKANLRPRRFSNRIRPPTPQPELEPKVAKKRITYGRLDLFAFMPKDPSKVPGEIQETLDWEEPWILEIYQTNELRPPKVPINDVRKNQKNPTTTGTNKNLNLYPTSTLTNLTSIPRTPIQSKESTITDLTNTAPARIPIHSKESTISIDFVPINDVIKNQKNPTTTGTSTLKKPRITYGRFDLYNYNTGKGEYPSMLEEVMLEPWFERIYKTRFGKKPLNFSKPLQVKAPRGNKTNLPVPASPATTDGLDNEKKFENGSQSITASVNTDQFNATSKTEPNLYDPATGSKNCIQFPKCFDAEPLWAKEKQF